MGGADPYGGRHTCGVGRTYDDGGVRRAEVAGVEQEGVGIVAGQDGVVVKGRSELLDDVIGGNAHVSPRLGAAVVTAPQTSGWR